MSHTAGPWAVHPVNAQVDAFVGGEPLPVCQLLWPTTERTEAETEANALLIAAAPDMLDALKVALGHLTGGMDGDWRNCDPRALIRAAIAKAEKLTQHQRSNQSAA